MQEKHLRRSWALTHLKKDFSSCPCSGESQHGTTSIDVIEKMCLRIPGGGFEEPELLAEVSDDLANG